ncbi:hypothetical protein L9F63_019641 [Diploptera punctata]|uniref:EGF-like domain-containing protein n=1 Tax=Diploptera punctata TaxID=6984 RepID=A0AAD7ZU76_DIPPU|nr:hypothetical protein L9F63_019641 [Diploptera punctata]
MAYFRKLSSAFLLALLIISVTGHKKHPRSVDSKIHEYRLLDKKDGQSVTCPPPLGVINVHSHSVNIAGITNQGGLSNLMFMCGTTQVPYNVPTEWVMREGPGGIMMNVTIYEKRYKMVPLCCPGYTRNQQDICVPKCKGNCTNGLCLNPNNCVCYNGYAENTMGDCVLTCPCGCPNGKCQGDICICNDQYTLGSNGVCNPICTNECVKGYCSSPNVCTCDLGYKKKKNQDSHICSPHCSLSCEHGTCVAPEDCKCNQGYVREKNTGRCIPKCHGCQYGDCVAPYTCHCQKGYKRQDENCVPTCVEGCFNATCTAPNVCTCFNGYKHSTPHTCVPRCFPSCQNAVCVAPNKCECYPGFMKKNLSSSYKCVAIISSVVSGIGSIVNSVTHR